MSNNHFGWVCVTVMFLSCLLTLLGLEGVYG
jgi:hypothetical protein